jgi:hypothetical protein
MDVQNQDIIDYAMEKYPEVMRYSIPLGHMVDKNLDITTRYGYIH